MSAYHKLAASSHALCIPADGLEEAFQKKGSASARQLATYERLTSVSLDKAHRRILILPRGIARDSGLTALNRTYSPEIDEKQVESFLELESHRETMLISSTLTMAANRPSSLHVQLPVRPSGCSSGCKYRGTLITSQRRHLRMEQLIGVGRFWQWLHPSFGPPLYQSEVLYAISGDASLH